MSDILYDLRDGVARITLNRPDVLNGFTVAMRAALHAALDRAEGEARVVVLTGAGRAFCAGQDLAESAGRGEADLERLLAEGYNPLITRLADFPLPTLAAVNGLAAGAGANLALACDIVIAAESAYFLQAFARIGLVPDAGGTWVLPRSVGLARALGAALLAERVPARQAADWGMIWEAVPDAEFAETVAARAAQLAAGPAGAYRLAKRLIRESYARDLPAQLAAEGQAQGVAGRSGDFREGLAAFLAKRPARFGEG